MLLLTTARPAAASVEEAYQKFVLQDRSVVFGIVVRQTRRGVVVATADGIVELSNRELRFQGSMSASARKADELLVIVEGNIREGDLDRVARNLVPLGRAVTAFEDFAGPVLQPSVSDDRPIKRAARAAVAYYREKLAEVEPTLEVLRRCEQVNALARDLTTKQRRYNSATLAELISQETAFAAIKRPTPLAEREKQEAIALLNQQVEAVVEALKVEALERLRTDCWTQDVLELVRALRQGHGLHSRYDREQQTVLTALLPVSRQYRTAVPPKVDAIASLELDFDATQKACTSALTNLRNIVALLKRVQEYANPSLPPAVTAQLAAELEAASSDLAVASSRRELILETRARFRHAEVVMSRDQFQEALETYQWVETRIQTAQLHAAELQQRSADGVFKAQALLLLETMRHADALDPQRLPDLAAQAQRLLQRQQARLDAVGVPVGVFRKAYLNLSNYEEFKSRLAAVVNALSDSPLAAWLHSIELSDWLAAHADEILPAAEREWQAFGDEKLQRLFTRASVAFFANPRVFSPAVQARGLRSFMDHLLQRADLAGARELLHRGLASGLTGSEFKRELAEASRRVGEAYAGKQDFEAAFSVYQEVQEAFPELAEAYAVDDLIAGLQVRRAEELLAAGKLPEALALYEQICQEHPSYAKRHNVFGKAIELRLRNADRLYQTNTTAALKLYNDVCARYAGKMLGTRSVDRVVADVLKRFSKAWDEARFVDAILAFGVFVEAYPDLAREARLPDRLVRLVWRRARQLRAEAERRHRVMPQAVIEALGLVAQRYPEASRHCHLDEELVGIKLDRAAQFVKARQVAKAFSAYHEIQSNFPELAAARSVSQKINSILWQYRIERIRLPLGLLGPRDLIVFSMVVFLVPLLFAQSIHVGRARGHLRYRLWHLAVTQGLFLLLMGAFLSAKLPFARAFMFAFVVPGALLNVVGSTTYFFFPLVYYERRLAVEHVLLAVLRVSLFGQSVQTVGLAPVARWLTTDLEHLQRHLPLLHDRWLFRIEMTRQLAESRPEVAYRRFERLLGLLDREIIKTQDWEAHHRACIFHAGRLALQLDDVEQGLAYLRQHAEAAPEHRETRQLLSEALFKLQRFEEAIPHLQLCLSADGTDGRLWFRLGRCLFETGDAQGAAKCFRKVDAPSREVQFYAARAHMRSGEFKEALKYFQRLLHQRPDDGRVLYYLASALARRGDYQQAMKLAALLKPDTPFFVQAVALQGGILLEMGQDEDARERFEKALELEPHCVSALLGLTKMALAAGRFDEARRFAQDVLTTDPADAAGNYYMGVACEASDAGKAVRHFTRALSSESFAAAAEHRLGRLHWERGEYEQAAARLEGITGRGEAAPEVLYLHAYSLAAVGRRHDCQQLLIRLLSAAERDDAWEQIAVKAMYSIGHVLLANQACQMALQCFEFVQTKAPEAAPEHLAELIEECRFRDLLALQFDRRCQEFLSAAAAFREATEDVSRRDLCDYYCMLAKLHQNDLNGAMAMLETLLKTDPHNPRCLYHRLVVELRAERQDAARRTMEQLLRNPDLPPHLAAGLETVKAYLKARKGLLRDAERLLQALEQSAHGFPGAAAVRRHAAETRILCLCHLREPERLAPLLETLPEDARARAALYEATAAVQGGQLERARESLAAHAGAEPDAARLYLSICLALADQALARDDPAAARDILASVPHLPGGAAELCPALDVTARVHDSDEPAVVHEHVSLLAGALKTSQEPLVRHLLIHNLAVCRLRQCLLAEAEPEAAGVGELYELWIKCLRFWEQNIFHGRTYWHRERALFASPDHPVPSLDEAQVDALVKAVRDEDLAGIFIAYVMADLAASRERALLRHLDLLHEFSKSGDRVQSHFARLSKQVNSFLRDQSKDTARAQTWEFLITSLVARMRLADVLGENRTGLEEELHLWRTCREHYETPEAYRETRKRFNTLLLDALQLGAMGSFVNAGSKLEKLLHDVPPGMELGKTEGVLHVLREACKKPEESVSKGMDLTSQFERLYTVVRDHATKPARSL